jgi:hypothetical protein
MLAMHLTASIAWIWTYIPQPRLDMSGVGLRNHGQVRLKNCLVVVDGRRAVYPDSIRQLVAVTHNYGHEMRWLYHWAHIESWLVEVNLAKKNSKDWSYIQGATSKFENIGQIGNLTCMLYLVDAILSGCCTWWILYLVDLYLVDLYWVLTYDHGMERQQEMTELYLTRWYNDTKSETEIGDENGNTMEHMSRYELSDQ